MVGIPLSFISCSRPLRSSVGALHNLESSLSNFTPHCYSQRVAIIPTRRHSLSIHNPLRWSLAATYSTLSILLATTLASTVLYKDSRLSTNSINLGQPLVVRLGAGDGGRCCYHCDSAVGFYASIEIRSKK